MVRVEVVVVYCMEVFGCGLPLVWGNTIFFPYQAEKKTTVPTHTEMTRLSQPCDKVVTTMSTIDKVVTTLWIGCQQLTRL